MRSTVGFDGPPTRRPYQESPTGGRGSSRGGRGGRGRGGGRGESRGGLRGDRGGSRGGYSGYDLQAFPALGGSDDSASSARPARRGSDRSAIPALGGSDPVLPALGGLDEVCSDNESSDEEQEAPFVAPLPRLEDPEPETLFAGTLARFSDPEPETPFASLFAQLEDPLQYDWMSACLASFTPSQRKCMLRYLVDQIRSLEITLRSEVGMFATMPPSTVAAALEEAHESMRKRNAGSNGRMRDVLGQFSAEQRSKIQSRVEESVTNVIKAFRMYGLPVKSDESIDQAILELRAMLADPLQKLLNSVK